MRDPYLYLDVDVLKNKDNVKSQDKLDLLESNVVPARIKGLMRQGMTISSVFDIQKIHKFLFGTIFDWAGEFRTITIYKKEPILDGASVDYTPSDYIKKEMNDLEEKFIQINWNELNNNEKIEKVASIVQELWQIHCFREGNTRSIAMFLYFLIKTVELHINVEFLGKNNQYFRNALVLASIYSASKPEYLQGIIADATTVKNYTSGKYETINGYEVKKYSYQNHTIEKIKTIKDL